MSRATHEAAAVSKTAWCKRTCRTWSSFCLSLSASPFCFSKAPSSIHLYSIRIPSLNVLKQMQLACTKYPAARASQELRRSFIVPGDGVSMFPFACAYCTFSPRLKKRSESCQHVSTKSRVLYKMVKMVPGCAKGQKKFILPRSGNSAGSWFFCLWLPNTPSNWWSRKANHSGMLRVWKEVRIIQNASKCYRHARPLQRAMRQHAAWNPGCSMESRLQGSLHVVDSNFRGK